MRTKTWLIVAAIGALAPATAYAQGIPVHDTAGTLQLIAQVKNSLQQIQQAEQMITQGGQLVTQATNTFNSLSKLTNAANIASVLNDRNVNQLLPSGVTDIVRLGQSDYGALGNFGSAAQGLSNRYTIQTNLGSNGTLSSAASAAYGRYLASVNQGPSVAATLGYNISNQTASVDSGLDEIRTEIGSAKDPKDTMDLNTRATIENAKINNRLLQLMAIQQYYASNARLGYNAYRLNNSAAAKAASDARIQANAAAYSGY